eukprot:6214231-Pleurochrysis_carterae.AAC.4
MRTRTCTRVRAFAHVRERVCTRASAWGARVRSCVRARGHVYARQGAPVLDGCDERRRVDRADDGEECARGAALVARRWHEAARRVEGGGGPRARRRERRREREAHVLAAAHAANWAGCAFLVLQRCGCKAAIRVLKWQRGGRVVCSLAILSREARLAPAPAAAARSRLARGRRRRRGWCRWCRGRRPPRGAAMRRWGARASSAAAARATARTRERRATSMGRGRGAATACSGGSEGETACRRWSGWWPAFAHEEGERGFRWKAVSVGGHGGKLYAWVRARACVRALARASLSVRAHEAECMDEHARGRAG